MTITTLIIPGLHNSGPDHWQTWMESKLEGAIRVEQEDWEHRLIRPWAKKVEQAILSANKPVFLVAHSFGVLASIVGAAPIADHVMGALFVAPADPSRFTITGERINQDSAELNTGLFNYIPKEYLGYPSTLAASLDDNCMPFKRTAWWAKTWGSKLESLGNAGHVNADSGFGPWPHGLSLYRALVNSVANENISLDLNQTFAY